VPTTTCDLASLTVEQAEYDSFPSGRVREAAQPLIVVHIPRRATDESLIRFNRSLILLIVPVCMRGGFSEA